jgi:hypothetical protein
MTEYQYKALHHVSEDPVTSIKIYNYGRTERMREYRAYRSIVQTMVLKWGPSIRGYDGDIVIVWTSIQLSQVTVQKI